MFGLIEKTFRKRYSLDTQSTSVTPIRANFMFARIAETPLPVLLMNLASRPEDGAVILNVWRTIGKTGDNGR